MTCFWQLHRVEYPFWKAHFTPALPNHSSFKSVIQRCLNRTRMSIKSLNSHFFKCFRTTCSFVALAPSEEALEVANPFVCDNNNMFANRSPTLDLYRDQERHERRRIRTAKTNSFEDFRHRSTASGWKMKRHFLPRKMIVSFDVCAHSYIILAKYDNLPASVDEIMIELSP